MSTRTLAVAQRLLDECNANAESGNAGVTPMQLIKLTYVAHGHMLGKHGVPLLDESVEAWEYGPVVPSVYHAVKEYRSGAIKAVKGAPKSFAFTNDEIEVMRKVAEVYGRVSGVTLSSSTHKPGTPWTETRALCGRNASISNDIIKDFYQRIQGQKHSTL